MKPVRFLLPAEQEMADAAMYYESQASGLGDNFLSRIDSAVRDISEHPEGWPAIRYGIRRRLVPRFPYALFYRITPEEIVVLAVAYLRRHPSYWTDRS